jgi:hypothetical protein
MRTIFIALLILLTLSTKSQERVDIGAIIGASYYLGDYNPGTQFYRSMPAIGVTLRRNLNDLYAIRFSGIMGGVQGSHSNDKFFLPGDTPDFSSRIINLESALEIGFIPFSTRSSQNRVVAPYVLVGIGGVYVNNSIIFHIPFGIGAKYSPAHRWSIGLEWRLHKTFNDQIDNYINVSERPKSFIHNNDWFGIAGFVLTYRVPNEGTICAVYK